MNANLAELLAAAAAESPQKVALVAADSGAQLTWAELDERVSRVAGGLAGEGLVAGNRVVIATANHLDFVVVYLAVLRARLVAVPVNPKSGTGELVRMVADAGARLVVADTTTVTSARSVVAGMEDALVGADDELKARTVVPRVMTVGCPALPGELRLEQLLESAPVDLPPARDPDALAVLLYTAGVGDQPRAAMLTHRALLANIEQATAVEPPLVTSDDVVYAVLPLFHVYGLNGLLGPVLRQHATLVVAESFDPERSLQHLAEHAVTVLPIAPPVVAYWRAVPQLRERLSGLRLLISGSAPLSADLVREFEERSGLTVHQGYGLTEAAPVVTSTLCSRSAPAGSVGAALPGVRLRIVDESGHDAETGDPGEIEVCGDNLFSGYWPDGADAPVDGWLATGDVGLLDAEGNLFLVDRLREVVVVSGFNVYPREVEDVLREVEGVEEVAVVGVDDADTGQAVVAYVRLDTDDPQRAGEIVDAAQEHCDRTLARFKRPSRIEVVDELPLTASGAVAKGRLRATIRRQQLGLIE